MPSNTMLLAVSLAVLVGCSGTPGPDLEVSGTLAFTYSGGGSGTFNASGPLTLDPAAGEFAVGGRHGAGLVITASRPRTTLTHDVVSMVIPRLTNGSSTVDAACLSFDCAGLLLTLGEANDDGLDFLEFCNVTAGTLTIATITDQRATGSFSGTGECVSSTNTTTAFEVTDGTFDVALALIVVG
jgi:hypothetical protein